MDNTASDTSAFCRFYGIASLKELPVSQYDDARSKLRNKLKKAA
jgi:hypothetical protein